MQVLNWFRYRRYYKSNKKVAATKAPPPATGIQADQQRFRIPQQLVFNPICAGELVPTPQVLNWFRYHRPLQQEHHHDWAVTHHQDEGTTSSLRFRKVRFRFK